MEVVDVIVKINIYTSYQEVYFHIFCDSLHCKSSIFLLIRQQNKGKITKLSLLQFLKYVKGKSSL